MEHLHFSGNFIRTTLESMLVRSADKALEQRMRLERLRLELGMKLAANKMWVVRQLDNFDVSSIGGSAGDAQPAGNQWLLVLAIEFVAVTMALTNLEFSID